MKQKILFNYIIIIYFISIDFFIYLYLILLNYSTNLNKIKNLTYYIQNKNNHITYKR